MEKQDILQKLQDFANHFSSFLPASSLKECLSLTLEKYDDICEANYFPILSFLQEQIRKNLTETYVNFPSLLFEKGNQFLKENRNLVDEDKRMFLSLLLRSSSANYSDILEQYPMIEEVLSSFFKRSSSGIKGSFVLIERYHEYQDILLAYVEKNKLPIDKNAFLQHFQSFGSSRLTDDEFDELFTRYRQGDAISKEQLASHYSSFVRGLASFYDSWSDDFYQEGMLGLTKALSTFDPTKNVRFITYAYTCIHNQLKKYLNFRSNSFHISNYKRSALYQILLGIRRLEQQYQRTLTFSEQEKLLGVSSSDLELFYSLYAKPKSLNEKIYSDDGEVYELVDFMSYDTIPFYEREESIASLLLKAKSILSPREYQVLYLAHYKNISHDQIAPSLGITRQRVDQILKEACTKLRESAEFSYYDPKPSILSQKIDELCSYDMKLATYIKYLTGIYPMKKVKNFLIARKMQIPISDVEELAARAERLRLPISELFTSKEEKSKITNFSYRSLPSSICLQKRPSAISKKKEDSLVKRKIPR